MASPGVLAPVAMRMLRHAFTRTSKLIRQRLENLNLTRPVPQLQPVRVSARQPLHPVARIRQAKGRWYTTHSTINATVRRFMSSGPIHAPKIDRASFPQSRTATAVSQLAGRAPFASTLRPNLTGGAFPRTAGGYSLGGGSKAGARHFSHSPAAPAQVISHVSTAMRAFLLNGQKARFDGMTPAGEKKYRGVSKFQEETARKVHAMPMSAPGSYIDFHVHPTVTALSPLSGAFPLGSSLDEAAPTLNTEGFMDILSVDFARALKDLSVVMNDLKKLSTYGDLPVSLVQKSIIRVRFPGCDADMVERLCDEIGVQRGIIHQDVDFDISVGGQMALQFPFCPTQEQTLTSPGGSLRSCTGHEIQEMEDYDVLEESNSCIEGYETGEASEDASAYFSKPSDPLASSDYEGLEGIYRFLEECDARRQ